MLTDCIGRYRSAAAAVALGTGAMSTPDHHRADPSEPEGLLPADSVLTFEDYMAMQKAIGEPKRFRILYALREFGAMSATELADSVDLAGNTLHHHLGKLVDVGLVVNRKRTERGDEGLYSYYEASALGHGILEDGVQALMRREWDHLERYSG